MSSFSPSERESSRGAACIGISGAGVIVSVGIPMSGDAMGGGNGAARPPGGGRGAGGGGDATGGGAAIGAGGGFMIGGSALMAVTR